MIGLMAAPYRVIDPPQHPWPRARAFLKLCGLLIAALAIFSLYSVMTREKPVLPAQSPMPAWIPAEQAAGLEKMLNSSGPQKKRWQSGSVYGHFTLVDRSENGCMRILLTREDVPPGYRSELIRCKS